MRKITCLRVQQGQLTAQQVLGFCFELGVPICKLVVGELDRPRNFAVVLKNAVLRFDMRPPEAHVS